MPATSLNPTQKHLLRMFSYAKSDKELEVLKDALCTYFSANIDKAMDELWDSGEWNDKKNEAVLKEHLRTSYND